MKTIPYSPEEIAAQDAILARLNDPAPPTQEDVVDAINTARESLMDIDPLSLWQRRALAQAAAILAP